MASNISYELYISIHILARVCNILFKPIIEEVEKTMMNKRCCRQDEGHCQIYICAHQCSMAVFLIYLSNLGLRMLGFTTFFTNFLMMDRLIKIRHGLEQMVRHLD